LLRATLLRDAYAHGPYAWNAVRDVLQTRYGAFGLLTTASRAARTRQRRTTRRCRCGDTARGRWRAGTTSRARNAVLLRCCRALPFVARVRVSAGGVHDNDNDAYAPFAAAAFAAHCRATFSAASRRAHTRMTARTVSCGLLRATRARLLYAHRAAALLHVAATRPSRILHIERGACAATSRLPWRGHAIFRYGALRCLRCRRFRVTHAAAARHARAPARRVLHASSRGTRCRARISCGAHFVRCAGFACAQRYALRIVFATARHFLPRCR